jgi:hypothetical protein
MRYRQGGLLQRLALRPPLQLWNPFCEKSSKEARKTHFPHLALDKLLHLLNGNVGLGKFAVLITMAAVHGAFCAIDFRAAPLFIFLERHSTTLTIFVVCFHGNILSFVFD